MLGTIRDWNGNGTKRVATMTTSNLIPLDLDGVMYRGASYGAAVPISLERVDDYLRIDQRVQFHGVREGRYTFTLTKDADVDRIVGLRIEASWKD